MRKISLVLGITFVFSLSFWSCSNNPRPEEQSSTMNDSANTPKDTTPVNEMASFHFTYTIANLPSPLLVLDEFAKSNLQGDASLLNPSENVDNYHTSLKQAFNYGIYGVDLGYLVVNNRTLDVIKYYNTSKKLAEKLNLSESFNRFVERFENNQENKDSLTHVIDEAYTATDAYLRSNERLGTASEVLAGSWIECQFITVNLLKTAERNKDNEILYQRVWEQRLYLDNIAKLLEEFKGEPELLKVKKDFDGLLTIYKEPADSKGITKEFLTKLGTELTRVRANIIK